MKIAYRWLQEYVRTALTPAELAERFVYTSAEVESLVDWSERYRNVVIGKVLTVEPHPSADKLRITRVDTGDQVRDIVCGAPNVTAETYVAVALPGSVLTPLSGPPIAIQSAVIRGVPSDGMICSAFELGLSNDQEGILQLSGQWKAGDTFAEAWGLNDCVLDLEITPNRPDLLSYFGIAREVATFEKKRLMEPPVSLTGDQHDRPSPLTVTVMDSRLCPRYSAVYLEGVTVQPSPTWMQARLLLSGIRPINNLVDTANYVMLELGQPLHAFDYDTLPRDAEGKAVLQVRAAQSGETIAALDDSTRTLPGGDILITDGRDQPVAIAGIIGGADSAISPSTTRVILESASFAGSQIRRTSRALGLRSEASTRFEKGLDPEMTVRALKRAAYLLQEQLPGMTLHEVIDVYTVPAKEKSRPRIHLTFDQVRHVIGIHLSAGETKTILQKLGFQITQLTKSAFEVIPPSWRADVRLPEDVIEELVRIWGYDRIPETLPSGIVKAPQPNLSIQRKATARRTLAALGYHETIHLTLISREMAKQAGFSESQWVTIPYPLSREMEILLPSHLVSFLHNLGGVNGNETEITLFEIGRIFVPPHQEREELSCMWRSSRSPETLIREAKAAVERLGQTLKLLTPFHYTYPDAADAGKYVHPQDNPAALAALYPESLVEIRLQEEIVGLLGAVRHSVLDACKIRAGRSVVFLQLDLEKIVAAPSGEPVFIPPPVYPTSERDLTVVVDQAIPLGKILESVAQAINPDICREWQVESIYTGKPIPEDRKSVTLRFTYNSPERTLADEEIQQDQDNILRQLVEHYQAEQRVS
jgi:phenylalanyl-tRNA synthetase beta chain